MDRSHLAQEIAAQNPNSLPAAKQLNPLVILIIEEVIKLLLSKCNLDFATINSPWFYQRWLLKRYISNARDKVMQYKEIYEPYPGSLDDIYDTLLNYGKNTSRSRFNKLIQEVQ